MIERNSARRKPDPSIIGWISTTDVMMLGMILMFLLALFIQVKYIRAQSEQRRISAILDKIPDALDLSSMKNELDKAMKELEHKTRELKAKEEQLAGLLSIESRWIVAKKEVDRLASIEAQWREAKEEIDRLVKELKTKDDDLTRLAHIETRWLAAEQELVRLAAIEAEWHEAKNEIQRLQALIQRKDQEIGGKKLLISDLEDKFKKARDRVLKPLEVSDLVIRLRCKTPPTWLDLDLYVQDPNANDEVCGYTKPRLLNGDTETGILIPSEDILALDGSTEEIFRSIKVNSTSPQTPYLIYCMLRDNGEAKVPGEIQVEVEWQVELRQNGKLTFVDGDKKLVTTLGELRIQNGNYSYPGLTAICGFELGKKPDGFDYKRIRSVPELPRNWASVAAGEGGTKVKKFRDSNR